jgi:hypothetical protein
MLSKRNSQATQQGLAFPFRPRILRVDAGHYFAAFGPGECVCHGADTTEEANEILDDTQLLWYEGIIRGFESENVNNVLLKDAFR